MSACDRCYAPGQCCRSLNLFGGRTYPDDPPLAPGTNEVRFTRANAVAEIDATLKGQGLEMLAAVKIHAAKPHDGVDMVTASFACSWLLPSGRCGGYEDRPTMCRVYEPEVDQLCVHYRGAEGYGG